MGRADAHHPGIQPSPGGFLAPAREATGRGAAPPRGGEIRSGKGARGRQEIRNSRAVGQVGLFHSVERYARLAMRSTRSRMER